MASAPRTPPGALTQEIAALLREYITRKQWKHGDVADAAGIAASTFSRVINGITAIDVEQLDRIAWAVGYPIEELVKTAEKNTTNRQASKGWPATRLASTSPS